MNHESEPLKLHKHSAEIFLKRLENSHLTGFQELMVIDQTKQDILTLKDEISEIKNLSESINLRTKPLPDMSYALAELARLQRRAELETDLTITCTGSNLEDLNSLANQIWEIAFKYGGITSDDEITNNRAKKALSEFFPNDPRVKNMADYIYSFHVIFK